MTVLRSISIASAVALMSTLTPTMGIAQECSITVTTWGGNYQATYESIIPAFEEANNCKVELVTGSSQDFIVRAQLGQVDVLTAPILHTMGAQADGLLMELTEENLPNLANLYDNARHSPYVVWANVGDYGLVYNSNYVTGDVSSWDVLWDPAYKNRVVLATFEALIGPFLAIQQAEAHGGSFEDIDVGLQRLADLVNSGNVLAQTDSESQLVSMFESDEAWIGPLTSGRLKDLWDRGMDHIKVSRPSEGTFPVITALSVVKTTQNAEMSLKFVDFLLSEGPQVAFAVNNLYAPSNKTVEIPADFEYRDLLVSGDDFDQMNVPDFLELNTVRGEWQERYLRMLR